MQSTEVIDKHTIKVIYEFYVDQLEITDICQTQQLPSDFFAYHFQNRVESYFITTKFEIDVNSVPSSQHCEFGVFITINMVGANSPVITKVITSVKKIYNKK